MRRGVNASACGISATHSCRVRRGTEHTPCRTVMRIRTAGIPRKYGTTLAGAPKRGPQRGRPTMAAPRRLAAQRERQYRSGACMICQEGRDPTRTRRRMRQEAATRVAPRRHPITRAKRRRHRGRGLRGAASASGRPCEAADASAGSNARRPRAHPKSRVKRRRRFTPGGSAPRWRIRTRARNGGDDQPVALERAAGASGRARETAVVETNAQSRVWRPMGLITAARPSGLTRRALTVSAPFCRAKTRRPSAGTPVSASLPAGHDGAVAR